MFKHSVTFYHYNEKSNAYTALYVDDVYIEKTTKTTAESNGRQRSASLRITTSPTMTKDFNNQWSVIVGDYVVLGHGKAIKSVKELPEYYSVTGITENVCGSAVDNIVIEAV